MVFLQLITYKNSLVEHIYYTSQENCLFYQALKIPTTSELRIVLAFFDGNDIFNIVFIKMAYSFEIAN